MEQIEKCKVISKTEIVNGVFDFTVENENIAKKTKCGQFLHIDCGDKSFLRRPISICDAFDDKVRFIFEVKGEGTKELSQKQVGEYIDVLGPLGHGFEIKNYKNPLIIGGGIGIFPLFKLAKELNSNANVFLGFRNKDRVCMEDEFDSVSKMCIVGTDDGSYGYNGYIANAMEHYIKNNPCDVIFSCGPMPMLKAVKGIAEENGIECQISLEQRMGCGIGACLVCVCESIFEGTNKYLRVCKNGPVFDSKVVKL
ncbi:MAG: dihydroorotate dehydrogenase electron transfer subunit [Clostridia bacterium]|nr:dihydroorotate dehydrogenase electron transfer subunit [Clostridia bacterium]